MAGDTTMAEILLSAKLDEKSLNAVASKFQDVVESMQKAGGNIELNVTGDLSKFVTDAKNLNEQLSTLKTTINGFSHSNKLDDLFDSRKISAAADALKRFNNIGKKNVGIDSKQLLQGMDAISKLIDKRSELENLASIDLSKFLDTKSLDKFGDALVRLNNMFDKNLSKGAKEFVSNLAQISTQAKDLTEALNKLGYAKVKKAVTPSQSTNTKKEKKNPIVAADTGITYDELIKNAKKFAKAQEAYMSGKGNVEQYLTVQKYADAYAKALGDIGNKSEEATAKQKELKKVVADINSYYEKGSRTDSVQKTFDIFNSNVGNQTESYKKSLLEISNTIREIEIATKGKNFVDFKVKDIESVRDQFKKIGNELVNIKKESKNLSDKPIDMTKLMKLDEQFTDWVSKNTKALGPFKTEIRALQEAFQTLRFDPSATVGDLEKLIQKISDVKKTTIETGNTGLSTFDKWKQSITGIVDQVGSLIDIYDIVGWVKDGFNMVLDLNTQMTELSKVSDYSLSDLESKFNEFKNISLEIGGTISDTISATADWARMGYSIPDSEELARVAQLYKNVGDNITIDEANKSLISTMQGFQMSADQAESIVDKFNAVSNNFAISSDEIGEALQRSAASFNVAGTDLDKSIALITSGQTVVQDATKVGTAFKTKIYRLFVQKCAISIHLKPVKPKALLLQCG